MAKSIGNCTYSENNIGICVDMHAANKATKRTRYPTPTVDDLLVKLKESHFFTKLDKASAFHPIELGQDSQFITGFQSGTRIKCFKRLIFGVNSAAEELQHALQTILADIPGATNIADDILIFTQNAKPETRPSKDTSNTRNANSRK